MKRMKKIAATLTAFLLLTAFSGAFPVHAVLLAEPEEGTVTENTFIMPGDFLSAWNFYQENGAISVQGEQIICIGDGHAEDWELTVQGSAGYTVAEKQEFIAPVFDLMPGEDVLLPDMGTGAVTCLVLTPTDYGTLYLDWTGKSPFNGAESDTYSAFYYYGEEPFSVSETKSYLSGQMFDFPHTQQEAKEWVEKNGNVTVKNGRVIFCAPIPDDTSTVTYQWYRDILGTTCSLEDAKESYHELSGYWNAKVKDRYALWIFRPLDSGIVDFDYHLFSFEKDQPHIPGESLEDYSIRYAFPGGDVSNMPDWVSESFFTAKWGLLTTEQPYLKMQDDVLLYMDTEGGAGYKVSFQDAGSTAEYEVLYSGGIYDFYPDEMPPYERPIGSPNYYAKVLRVVSPGELHLKWKKGQRPEEFSKIEVAHINEYILTVDDALQLSLQEDYSGVQGDINSDNTFNLTDMLALEQFLHGLNSTDGISAADMNHDGEIDAFDLAMMKRELLCGYAWIAIYGS